jgi:5-methylcytosine-specific restriction endonuclease McrA
MLRRKRRRIDIDKLKERNAFFEKIWKDRPHRCEITKASLGDEPNSMYFHHILPKSKYPSFEFNEENIIILHPNIHASVEMDMYKYPEINERRIALKVNYGL